MIRNALRIAILSALVIPFTAQEADAQRIRIGRGGIGIDFGGQRFRRNRRGCSPRRHCHTSACRQWIPPRCETVYERVWVPGQVTRRWCEPVYRTSYDSCGNPIQVLVRAGYYRTYQEPGCYRRVPRTINHPGRYRYRCGY